MNGLVSVYLPDPEVIAGCSYPPCLPQFGLRIEYWLLPYVNMVIECLQSQSAAGALPHVLGILTGHIYHFFSVIWPKMGGRRYLAAPGVLEAVIAGEKKEAKGADSESSSGFKVPKKAKASKKSSKKSGKGKKNRG